MCGRFIHDGRRHGDEAPPEEGVKGIMQEKKHLFQREEAFLRAQREAERKRQERELLHLQEEQERLQRKKVPHLHTSGCSSVSAPLESFVTQVFFGFLSPENRGDHEANTEE